MKFLRILVIVTCLNVPCAHAMEKSSTINRIIVPMTKAAAATAGTVLMYDGYQTIVRGKTFVLPSIREVSTNTTVTDVCRVTTGVVSFYAGWGLALDQVMRYLQQS
jgi:hypothetical protein